MIAGMTYYQILWYFMFYSFSGWVVEVIYHAVTKGQVINRGFLNGPLCPVYGFGALAFLLLVYPLIRHREYKKRILWIPVVFLLCMLIATAIELATSYALEAITGSWPWQTYADYKINFQARIALSPSIRFGIGGVLFLYVLQPLFEKITDRMSEKALRFIGILLVIILATDLLCTIM